MPPAPLTTVHLWRVPARRVLAALGRLTADRDRLRRDRGCTFAKLLGTGDGDTFASRDVDVRTWALVAVWQTPAALAAFERASPVSRGWARLAEERYRADLLALASRGRWSGAAPFASTDDHAGARWQPADATASRWTGPAAALTRARLRPARLRRFWAAVPPVAADLADARGLRLRLGIGEAPIGVQGTFSLWSSTRALTDFAYHAPGHRRAVARTPTEGWYAEELFARFAVLQTTGTIFGADPLDDTDPLPDR